jgi:hypothetical protein
VKNEDGEWDQSRVDISEPNEHGVHCSQGVLLNFWNLEKIQENCKDLITKVKNIYWN